MRHVETGIGQKLARLVQQSLPPVENYADYKKRAIQLDNAERSANIGQIYLDKRQEEQKQASRQIQHPPPGTRTNWSTAPGWGVGGSYNRPAHLVRQSLPPVETYADY